MRTESKFKEMAFIKHTWESKINKHEIIRKLSEKVLQMRIWKTKKWVSYSH